MLKYIRNLIAKITFRRRRQTWEDIEALALMHIEARRALLNQKGDYDHEKHVKAHVESLRKINNADNI